MPKEKKAAKPPKKDEPRAVETSAPAPAPRQVEALCPTCVEHSGYADPARREFCETCDGSGRTIALETQTQTCPACKGKHHLQQDPCGHCAHTGRIMIEEGAARIAGAKAESDAKAIEEAFQATLAEAREEGRQIGLDEFAESETYKLQIDEAYQKGFDAGQKEPRGQS